MFHIPWGVLLKDRIGSAVKAKLEKILHSEIDQNTKWTEIMKRILYPIIILSLMLVFSGCGTNTNLDNEDPQDLINYGTAETFEVVTWNLREFPLLLPQTLDQLTAIIPMMNVDLLAFQEINDQASFLELARMIPHYSAYISSATSSYRLAYLYDSRTVTVNDQYTIFDGDSNPFPRPPYVLDINWQDQNLLIVNNHLKAFGDNYIDETDDWDEEYRRRLACQKLDLHIRQNWDDRAVIVLGDMNDQIAEPPEYNVFMAFLDRPAEYLFADLNIAQNPSPATVSYPPSFSHIDHILITDELFASFANPNSSCDTLPMELMLGSWDNYSNQLSDHRPVGIRLQFAPPR